MANTLNAVWLSRRSSVGTGSSPTYEQVRMAIKNGNTTAIFYGDPVIQATGTTGPWHWATSLKPQSLLRSPSPAALFRLASSPSRFTASGCPSGWLDAGCLRRNLDGLHGQRGFHHYRLFDHHGGGCLLWRLHDRHCNRVRLYPDRGRLHWLRLPEHRDETNGLVSVLAGNF